MALLPRGEWVDEVRLVQESCDYEYPSPPLPPSAHLRLPYRTLSRYALASTALKITIGICQWKRRSPVGDSTCRSSAVTWSSTFDDDRRRRHFWSCGHGYFILMSSLFVCMCSQHVSVILWHRSLKSCWVFAMVQKAPRTHTGRSEESIICSLYRQYARSPLDISFCFKSAYHQYKEQFASYVRLLWRGSCTRGSRAMTADRVHGHDMCNIIYVMLLSLQSLYTCYRTTVRQRE